MLFYSDGTEDEIWIRTTIEQAIKQNIKVILLIISDKIPENLKSFYHKIGCPVIVTKLRDLNKYIPAQVLATATSCIDKNQFHSSIKNFIYMPHTFASLHSVYPEHTFDSFTTIFAAGPHHVQEFQMLKQAKNQPFFIYETGYGKLDCLKQVQSSNQKILLIAPSWGFYDIRLIFNIDLLRLLLENFQVVIRPHPMSYKKNQSYFDSLIQQEDRVILDQNFDSTEYLEKASVLISDYSGISMEFMALHKKPVIYLDLPKKIANNKFNTFNLDPMEVKIRNVYPNRIFQPEDITGIVDAAINISKENIKILDETINQFVYNVGNTGFVAANQLLSLIKNNQ